MFEGRKIFFSALDWGLGHATRSVPIIRELEKNNEVILGTTPLTSTIWNKEFPHLKNISVPSYSISYSSLLPIWMKLALDSPRILRVISQENKELKSLIRKFKIDLVISDNRFGMYSPEVHCIFITHQVFLRTPAFQKTAQKVNASFISKYSELWIPDFEDTDRSLSGELAHGEHYHPNVKYIGPQSRLKKINNEKEFDYLMMVSGPEPQRTKLHEAFIKLTKDHKNKKFALISPLDTQAPPGNLFSVCNPDAELISSLISKSDHLMCRSGYSTLMDIYSCGAKQLSLIPTRGQTEQEYLADFWKSKYGAKIIDERNLIRQDLT